MRIGISYQVDGLTVEGYYLKPTQSEQNSLPVIIYNRGGNGEFGYVFFAKKMEFLAQVALQGFIVIGSQYRGASPSIKNNGKDEFGGADVNDVRALLPLIKQIPGADITRLGMMGWSRGADQSYQAVLGMPEVKALVAIAGVSNAFSELKRRPEMEKVYLQRIADFAANRERELTNRSAALWLDKLPVDLPILLIHGGQDQRVDVSQSIDFAAQLTQAGHLNKLVVYPDDNHGLLNNRGKLLTEVTDWFSQYLTSSP